MKLIEKGYKMLVCDFDLSLSKTDRTISDRTIASIRQFQSDGGIFGVCTGRALPSLDIIYEKYGLKGFKICYHGSIIIDENGQILSDISMSYEQAVEVLNILNPHNESFFIAYIGDRIYCNIDCEKRNYYMSMTKVEVIVNTALAEWIEENRLSVRKILIIDDALKIQRIMNESIGKIPSCIQASISQPDFIEAVHTDSSKGAAVIRLAEHLNIPLSQVAAVGDSSIDVSMLKVVGAGIAVKNADIGTKREAEFIADYSCDEDAVYYIIEESAFKKNSDYLQANSNE